MVNNDGALTESAIEFPKWKNTANSRQVTTQPFRKRRPALNGAQRQMDNTFGSVVEDYMLLKPRTKLIVVIPASCTSTAASATIYLRIKNQQ